ncbi:hypothetical protein MMPV_001465 [Pyropia vietnamensis]
MARVVRRWRAAVALAVVTAGAVVGSPPSGGGVAAHSSCLHPLESTWSNACRIGGMNGAWKNCPGPCPHDPDRKVYKVESFRRGQWFPLVYYKNNHSGGFMRLSLVFPDGEYYLGYAWYGGSSRQGDYYSCAKIRIQGGPIQDWWNPIYVNHRNGQCQTTAGALGQCRKEPCFRPTRWIRPDDWNGHTPKRLNRWEVTK